MRQGLTPHDKKKIKNVATERIGKSESKLNAQSTNDDMGVGLGWV